MNNSEMIEFFCARITFIAGVLVFAAVAVATLLSKPEKLSFSEPLARNRWIGLFVGWFALVLCVPHAVVVAPAFLIPWLWPIALIVPVLGFFSLDYPAARALGGAFIFLGYYLVHYSFDFWTPGGAVIAVAGWLTGIAGIWISGKPCAMRDYFRITARRKSIRFICAAFWGVEMLLALWALVMTKGGAL